MAASRVTPLALALAASSMIRLASAVPASWDGQDRVTLPDSVHPRLARLEPVRPVDPDARLENMVLVLKMDPARRGERDQLLKDQQDPASAAYHQWLTPQEFGRRFGPAQAQVDAATLWLLQQGFTVRGASRSGLAITFSGTASQVGRAFGTAIMEYQVDGVLRHGNATPVSLPRALSGFVGGVLTLHDMPRKAGHRILGSLPLYTTTGGSHYISPGDFAAIYNTNPLHAAGINGAGVTIGIVGRSDLNPTDVSGFAAQFATSDNLTVIHNGADPGILDLNEQFEASLDVEWSQAIAPGAAVQFVVSPSSLATDGTDLSAQYLVDANQVQVISTSFGSCEANMGTSENQFYEQLWAQAAGQGISVFVAAGDNGPAGCDNPVDFQGTGPAVSGLASTPYNTAVGGTMFNEGTGTYWSATNASGSYVSASGYIPELPWNESGSTSGGDRLWAGSGGPSSLYAKPAWQALVATVPADGHRDLPDVSLSAAGAHDPYLVAVDGNLYLGGGTSIASPCMAGIMALVIQKAGGARQGNANPTLYALAHAQYDQSGPAVFHDVASGNNAVPGVPGYSATAGYDMATGLGSLDAAALASNWAASANPLSVTLAAPAGPVTIASGGSVSFSGSAADSSSGAAPTLTWSFGDGSPTVSGAAATHTYLVQGAQSRTYTASLTATSAGGQWTQTRTVNVTVTPAGVSAYITTPVLALLALPGLPIPFSATATTQNGGSIAGYAWSFGDGGTATGPNVTHAFASNPNGPYTVTLTATDTTGAQGQASLQVYANTTWALNVNFDNAVDVRDLLVMATAWGTSATSATALNGFYPWGADLNGDGRIDDTDFNLWIQNFTPGAP